MHTGTPKYNWINILSVKPKINKRNQKLRPEPLLMKQKKKGVCNILEKFGDMKAVHAEDSN